MGKIVLSERCMACTACVNTCKKKAIYMVIDEDGFYKPVIDERLCVGCKSCIRVCPEVEMPINLNKVTPKNYVVWAQNEVRENSSSGGAFYELAVSILLEKGSVYGCAWNDGFLTEHIRIADLKELSKLQKSKYVQSDLGNIYLYVKRDLEDGKKVLFSGVPCQIAGLYKFLGVNDNNLYTVDIICSGMGAVGVWKSYLEELIAKNGDIKSIDFRSKEFGWKCGPVLYSFKDGSELKNLHDIYMRTYLSGMFRKEVCSDCNYAEFPRFADITIGDFWNIQKKNPEYDDNKGTSVLIVNSSKGEQLFEGLKKRYVLCDEIDFDFTKTSNMFFRKRKNHPGSNVFCDSFREGKSVKESFLRAKSKNGTVDIRTIKNRKVVLFGTGNVFADFYDVLASLLDIRYVCDNDKLKWNNTYFNKKCIPPHELKDIGNPFVIIMIDNKKAVVQIKEQLREYGIEDSIGYDELLLG